MRMRHSIGTKLLVLKGKMLSPPKGTHNEFASSKLTSAARVSKGKSSNKSIPGMGKPSPSTSRVPNIPCEMPSAPLSDDKGLQSTDIPAVPVLRSPPSFGLHV